MKQDNRRTRSFQDKMQTRAIDGNESRNCAIVTVRDARGYISLF